MDAAICIHPNDNVWVARRQLVGGESVGSVTVRGMVPAGHKLAVQPIAAGNSVLRYNQTIGVATRDIQPGQHVHLHNMAFAAGQRSETPCEAYVPTALCNELASFQGIVRADGRVATRNYIGILTSVNCSATVARAIADRFRRDLFPHELADRPDIDGVVALTHGLGCATDSAGEGLAVLQRTLAGYASHANFAAVLVIGLGCETNHIPGLLAASGLTPGEHLQTYNIQEVGGTQQAIERGLERVRQLVRELPQVKRVPVPARHLVVGLQCGGSDGYSGISANPALGAAVDRLVRNGGTAILSETPEIYGGEHLLLRRAATPKVAEQLMARVRWWEGHVARLGGSMDNNPSAGNKAGGLTTILEKSLGAIAKGGTTGLMAVYEYAQPVQQSGFVFMDTPGYDPVSATGQVAGGANLICFTTGRGSAYGCAPTPSLKLSTNTALYTRQADDIDLNCGTVIDGTESVDEAGERIFQLMLQAASGVRTRSEIHGYGQNEFLPWQLGATM